MEADTEITHTSVHITADSATYTNQSSSSNTVQESGKFANFLSQIFAGESVAPNYSPQVNINSKSNILLSGKNVLYL